MTPQRTGSHRSTYKAIFEQSVARHPHWRDVRSMLYALAEVVEEPNGTLTVTHGQQTLVVRPPSDRTVAEIGELVKIRHFLDRSGAASPEAVATGVHPLVVD